MSKIEVNQTIYLRATERRGDNEPTVLETVVSKVGRKYFTVANMGNLRFHNDTLMHDGGEYMAAWKCYLLLQDIADEKETNVILASLRQVFSCSNKLTLDQLRRINVIVEEVRK